MNGSPGIPVPKDPGRMAPLYEQSFAALARKPSEDRYRMAYHLERLPTGAWVVAEVRFASPPVVGRASALSQVPIAAHGLPAKEPAPSNGK
jgi:hypothetical protein